MSIVTERELKLEQEVERLKEKLRCIKSIFVNSGIWNRDFEIIFKEI